MIVGNIVESPEVSGLSFTSQFKSAQTGLDIITTWHGIPNIVSKPTTATSNQFSTTTKIPTGLVIPFGSISDANTRVQMLRATWIDLATSIENTKLSLLPLHQMVLVIKYGIIHLTSVNNQFLVTKLNLWWFESQHKKAVNLKKLFIELITLKLHSRATIKVTCNKCCVKKRSLILPDTPELHRSLCQIQTPDYISILNSSYQNNAVQAESINL